MNINKPFWQQRTFWAGVVTFALALPTIVDQVAPFLTPEQRLRALGWAALVAALAGQFGRTGGVDAAKEVGRRAGVVEPAEESAP